jgi:hypothetical protein
MWLGGPRPPLVPISVPLQQQAQQQALLAQQQQALFAHQQQPAATVAAPDGIGQWVALRHYNHVAGLPSWDPSTLASAFSTTSLTHLHPTSGILTQVLLHI